MEARSGERRHTQTVNWAHDSPFEWRVNVQLAVLSTNFFNVSGIAGCFRRNQGLSLWVHGLASLEVFPVERLPGVRAIEESNADITDDLWIEVPDVHTQPLVLLSVQGFPVGCAAASTTPDSAQSLVALNVLVGVFRVALKLDGADIVVGPERAQSSANGAVAVGDLSRTTRDFNLNGTAVTGSFEHASAAMVN
jgi:hypothetical protein